MSSHVPRPPYDVERNFTYHPPQPGAIPKFNMVREDAKYLAETILSQCPDSPERTLALQKIEEAVMWANASIAREDQ